MGRSQVGVVGWRSQVRAVGSAGELAASGRAAETRRHGHTWPPDRECALTYGSITSEAESPSQLSSAADETRLCVSSLAVEALKAVQEGYTGS